MKVSIDRALLERVLYLVSGLQDARFQFVIPELREALQAKPELFGNPEQLPPDIEGFPV